MFAREKLRKRCNDEKQVLIIANPYAMSVIFCNFVRTKQKKRKEVT